MTLSAPITLALHDVGADGLRVLVDDVRRGLRDTPKHLPSRYLYDERGCELFEAITELPEYYVTRTEDGLLRQYAGEIVDAAQPEAIVELGSGSCRKTQSFIEAGRRRERLRHFVPFDISEGAVRTASGDLVGRFPGLLVHGVVGDFEAHLAAVPRLGQQLVLFLGSTIGNLEPDEQVAFLRQVRALLEPDDAFLLGVDLVKDEALFDAAYNDAQGITAAFNLNLLEVLNRELSANFDLEAFEHLAFYEAAAQRVEMHLRSRRDQSVDVPGAGLRADFDAGECLRTEISAKFTLGTARAVLENAGMRLCEWYTDQEQRFGLALARPAA
ncbi:MAG: L-histidine N(alpha)-methyltransferase [Candidatus Dormiibacterota bacterium]